MAYLHVHPGKRGRNKVLDTWAERRLTESKRGAGLHNIERNVQIAVHFLTDSRRCLDET